MNTVTLLHKSHQVGSSSKNLDFSFAYCEKPTTPTFFPRIIREFDDSDEPMIYGGKYD